MPYTDEAMLAVFKRVDEIIRNNSGNVRIPIPFNTEDERDCFNYAVYKKHINGGSDGASSVSAEGKKEIHKLVRRIGKHQRSLRLFQLENRRFKLENRRIEREIKRFDWERERIEQEARRFEWENKRHGREKIKHWLDIFTIILSIVSLLVSITAVTLLALSR